MDASVLLCLLNGEPGSERVLEALPAAVIGSANLAEVVSKLLEHDLGVEEVEDVLESLLLDVRLSPLPRRYALGHLRPATQSLGLSLGDGVRLSLAADLGAPVLTAGQTWGGLEIGVQVELIQG
ncbi:VapC toxin family PIN domain ribonuclease [Paracoccus sediminis]|uniref:PIN domain nuclease, a component of toxin-antitoxin system (PIN domain) n=1 Tax=Paracoccus sediminis TaxID=1214787 RepID=A0A238YGU2_9RHOB|nr:type II toxin-antitoxin system VapC family toxin [Paracoccus sediminis]TBN46648.1 VapC toxin family PIN domain ribonuclease [Paracoccus sediminis]SNR70290.1 PIN domain nuclease, a component of toxin-antitoxin system (PIN domain) [Paracoccus sediminis]